MTDDIDKLAGYHTAIMSEVRELTDFGDRMMAKAMPPTGRNSRRWLEAACLSVRRVCEYIAVAVVFAHHLDGHEGPDLTKWSPKDLLASVNQLSDHPMPAPLARIQSGQPLKMTAKPIGPQCLSVLFGQCSNLLHVGAPDRIIEQKIPPFDLARMRSVIAELRTIANAHVILLPKIKRVLIWDGIARQAFVGAADGEGCLAAQGLPDLQMRIYA